MCDGHNLMECIILLTVSCKRRHDIYDSLFMRSGVVARSCLPSHPRLLVQQHHCKTDPTFSVSKLQATISPSFPRIDATRVSPLRLALLLDQFSRIVATPLRASNHGTKLPTFPWTYPAFTCASRFSHRYPTDEACKCHDPRSVPSR